MRSVGHNHSEAYCLMIYRSDDLTQEEVIWNSRDGVTPFVITIGADELGIARQATHNLWSEDTTCTRVMADALGVRRFVDMTEALARPRAAEYVDGQWDNERIPMSVSFPDKATAIQAMVDSWLESPGSPVLVTAAEHAATEEP